MVETVLVSVSCAVSVLAVAIAALALRAADPENVRRTVNALRRDFDEVQNKVRNLEDVELPRIEAHAEAILERADLRFETAESKRKSANAKLQRLAGADSGGDGPPSWMDEKASEEERRLELGRHFRR